MTTTRSINDTTKLDVLYMALELSNAKWRLAFGAGGRERQVVVDAGDLSGLTAAIDRAQAKLGVGSEAKVISVYEAGRDGFWLHRWLEAQGIDSRVIDAGSLERRPGKRHRKTDRLDARVLLRKLRQYEAGDRGVFSVVRVPPAEIEDLRRLERERARLVKERGAHRSRMKALLNLHGIKPVKLTGDVPGRLAGMRQWDGSPLPGHLVAELAREWARLEQVEAQLAAVEAEQRAQVQEAEVAPMALVWELMRLKSLGLKSALTLVLELFGWREFANRRELAGCVGLVPTPYDSGLQRRELGIGKQGNALVRAVLIELAWRWLRWQPDSELSRWYHRRFGSGGKRQRRIGIVALARKLLIVLWRYLRDGVLPPDVRLKAV